LRFARPRLGPRPELPLFESLVPALEGLELGAFSELLEAAGVLEAASEFVPPAGADAVSEPPSGFAADEAGVPLRA
jgi:hypothetical protein